MKINIRGFWSLKSLWASWQSLLSLPWTFQVRDEFLNESWSWESAIATPSHCNTWNLSRWAAEKCKVTDTGFVSRIFMPYLQSYHILSYPIIPYAVSDPTTPASSSSCATGSDTDTDTELGLKSPRLQNHHHHQDLWAPLSAAQTPKLFSD